MRFLRPLAGVLATALGIASVVTPAAAQTGPGGNLQAQDTAIQAGSVPTTTDAVASTTSISGLRQWRFSLGNSGTSPASGATIAVRTPSTGPALNNAAQFGFAAQLNAPFSTTPTPPTPVSCQPPSATDESCGPASVAPGGGQLEVFSGSMGPGQSGPGVSTTFTPGFDSARNGTVGGLWSVPVTLTDATRFAQGDVMVTLRGHFPPGGAQVTTANGTAVPACQPSSASTCSWPPQFQPAGGADCGGAWLFHLQGAQLSTQYVFSAQQGNCATGKPIVDITANSFSPPTSPTVADSAIIEDPNLGTITFTVSPAATGSPANSFNTATNNQVQLEYQGEAPACPPNCGGPGGNLQAQDTTIQAGSVPTTTDTVASTASLSGLRQWEFSLGKSGTSLASGATIAIRTASTGPALNDPAQFGFSAQLNGPPGSPTPPSQVTCAPPTSTDESCGPVNVASGGGELRVFTGSAPPGQPTPGVPTTFTPGFDSARNGTAGGQWTVPVTLSQARFPQNGDIMVSLRGNFQQSAGAQITTASGPVSACPQGAFSTTGCSESQFQPGGQGSCNGAGAWFLAVHNAQSATTYTFAATQDPCASGKPVVDITAGSFSPPTDPTTADSVPIQDPNLGTITFAVNAAAAGSPPNSFNTATNNQLQLEYQGVAPACPPNCGGPGSNLGAQEINSQTESVPATTDSVSGTTSVDGIRTWNFFLQNLQQSPVNGTEISVDSTPTGIDLGDTSHFAWSAFASNPPPGQSASVACTASKTMATCGPSTVAIGSGGDLGVSTGPGIPSTFMPGFDSQRQGVIGGQWSVSVSLTDANRYGQGTEIFVGLDGNFVDNSAQVTANGSAVAQCSQSGPASGTCVRPPQFVPGGSGACGGLWFFDLLGAQLSTTAKPNQYVFTAQQGSCANAKPIVDVGADHSVQNCCTPGDSAALTDPDLGIITYSANPSTPANSFGTAVDRVVNVHYEGGPSCPPNCAAPPAPVSSPALPFTGGRGQHHALPPARILDTRDGTGAVAMSSLAMRDAMDRMSAANLGPGGMMDVQIAGRGGVPASGVAAVIMNVTVTNTTGSGYLVVYPKGVDRPIASNLNWTSGQTVPNLVEVPLGADGKVTVYNSAGATDVIFDVAGYVSTSDRSIGLSGLYNPLVPTRLLDTRTGFGGATTVGAGGTVSLQVTGRGQVPATGISAVVLNVTATGPTTSSYVTVWPDGAARPVASNLNFVAGQTVPNRVMVPVGAGGKVDLYNFTGSVDLVVDVGGYFTDSTSGGTGSALAPLAPARILDTRDGTGGVSLPLGQGGVLAVQVAGLKGVPAMTSATPPRAVVLNVTVTNPTAGSYLTLWPSGSAVPLASDLNFTRGQTVANLVVVRVGADGKVDLFNPAGSIDVVIDVVGWYG